MNEGNNGNGGRMVAAFLGGVAVGAGVALLTSPRSGRENRQQIAEYARSGKDKAGRVPHAANAAADAARKAFTEAMEQPQA